jgi:hypothetical protein
MSTDTLKITHFASLIQRFPTWEELRSHLESPAGGSLRVVDPKDGVAVIRYEKGKSDLASPELGVGLFRSVLWNTGTNRPVSFAPAKAREGVPPTGVALASTEDFVDGFMLNVATDSAGALLVATRTQIGGTNTFYSEKSFGELFNDALQATPLKTREGLAAALGPNAFASFVVQHPDHRIVAKIVTPGLYCVHIGSVEADGTVTVVERPAGWPAALQRLQIASYPLRFFRSEQEIEDLLRKTAVQRGWRWQGLVFKDGLGGRWRLRTDTYRMLRDLRGSEATAQDRFFRLREARKVVDYLKHYGEERQVFWAFEQALRTRTQSVLDAYNDCHKAHAVAFKDLPEAYRPAVFQLHLLWRDQLREKGFKVRLQNAIAVVNKLRNFEKRRLLDADVYTPVAPSTTPAEDQEPAVPVVPMEVVD